MSLLPPSYDLVLAVQPKHRLSFALLSCGEPIPACWLWWAVHWWWTFSGCIPRSQSSGWSHLVPRRAKQSKARCVEFQNWECLSQIRLWHAAVMAFHSAECMAWLVNYCRYWNCEIKWPWVKTGGAGRIKLTFCASRVPCILRKSFAEGGQRDFSLLFFSFPYVFVLFYSTSTVMLLILTGSC